MDIEVAGYFKRICAFLIDIVFVAIIGFLCYIIFMQRGMNTIFHTSDLRSEYVQIGIDMGVFLKDTSVIDGFVDNPEATKEMLSAFNNDSRVIELSRQISLIGILTICLCALIGEIIMYLIIPLTQKNGETFGKWILHLGVASYDGVRVKKIQIVCRFLVLFFIETALAISFYGTAFFISVFIFLISRKRQSLHDLICRTIVVDTQTSLIFNTREEKNKYNKDLKKHLKNIEDITKEPVLPNEKSIVSINKK